MHDLYYLFTGAMIGYAAKLHRGEEWVWDGVSHSKNGVSHIIIEKFPAYGHISAGIDHVMWNAGLVLMGGGILGSVLPEHHDIPYALAAAAVYGVSALDYKLRESDRQLDLCTALQRAADIIVPIATVYGVMH